MKRLLVIGAASLALFVVMGSGTCTSGGYCTTTVVGNQAPAYRQHCESGNKGNPINCVLDARPDRLLRHGAQYDTPADGRWPHDPAAYTTIVLPPDQDGRRLELYVPNAAMSKPVCT